MMTVRYIYNTKRPYIRDKRLIYEIKRRGGFMFTDLEPDSFNFTRTIERRFQNVINNFHYLHYIDKTRKLKHGLINNSLPNGFAAISSDGFDFIGINQGSIISLIGIFNRLFSHPLIFPNIGDVSKESSERTKTIIYKNTEFMYREFITPNCPIRYAASMTAFFMALDFIIHHECAHLLNGHIDFIGKNNSMFFMDESRTSDRDKNLTRQTLEMDADSTAVYCSMANVERELHLERNPNISEPSIVARDTIYEDIESSLVFLGFSIDVANKIMDEDVNWNKHDQSNWSHPMPNFRRFFNFEQMCYIMNGLDSNNAKNKDVAMKYFINMNLLDSCWSDIQGLPLEHKLIYNDIFNNDDVHDYYRSLRVRWSEIRPELLKYKRGKSLAEPLE